MEQTNKVPLYKELNEKRKSLNWIVAKAFKNAQWYESNINADGNEVIARVFGDDQYTTQTNAEYTALAVNNFHSIAENLERILDRIEENEIQNCFPSAYQRAKEALSKIS